MLMLVIVVVAAAAFAFLMFVLMVVTAAARPFFMFMFSVTAGGLICAFLPGGIFRLFLRTRGFSLMGFPKKIFLVGHMNCSILSICL
jgi:hypothetical protein